MDTPELHADLMLHPRWLAPVRPRTVLTDHSLAIRAGRIAAVVPRAQVADWRVGRHVQLPSHLLTPGLCNAHCHAAMTLLRGSAEGLPLARWLQDEVWPREARLVSPAMIADGTRLAIAEMLHGGITTFADMYFHPEVAASAVAASGIRAQVAFPLIRFPNAWSRDVEEGLHRGLELYDAWRGHDRIHVAFGPHSVYALDRQDLVRIATLADELDCPVHMHVHETAAEVADCVAAEGVRPLELLVRTGLAGPRLQAVHVTQADEADRSILREHSIAVMHCPRSNAKLGSGRAPVEDFDADGLRTAFGTDGAASNNLLDLVAEADFSVLSARERLHADRQQAPLAILERLTLGGARVLGIDGETGTLEPGRSADVVAFDLSAFRFLPVHDPVVAMLHGHGGRAASDVWVAGQPLLAAGRLQTLDGEDLRARAEHWRVRIADGSTR